MRILINSVRQSIKNKNWVSALFVALAMLDICGYINDPSCEVKKRYLSWFNEYLLTEYENYLSAEDCYYLRCACLHSGLDSHSKMHVDRVHFTAPEKFIVHKALLHDANTALQLQVDIFCEDMCIATEQWLKDIENNQETTQRMNDFVNFYPLSSLEPFISFHNN